MECVIRGLTGEWTGEINKKGQPHGDGVLVRTGGFTTIYATCQNGLFDGLSKYTVL